MKRKAKLTTQKDLKLKILIKRTRAEIKIKNKL
jgi:hypothetical protein